MTHPVVAVTLNSHLAVFVVHTNGNARLDFIQVIRPRILPRFGSAIASCFVDGNR